METVFSKQLQKLRKQSSITQEQLAAKLGVTAQAVSKWENGSYPDGDLLPKIADIFDVSIDNLYGRGEERCLGDGGSADGAALGDGDGVFEMPELSGRRSFSILFIRPNSPRILETQAHRPCPPAW